MLHDRKTPKTKNQKPCITMKKVIDRGKRSKTLSEVKQVENISKNLRDN